MSAVLPPPAAVPPVPARRRSLRSRLLAIAAISCFCAWLTGGAAVYLAVQRADSQLFDARLTDIAQTLLAFADHEIAEVQQEGGKLPVHIDTEGTAQDRYRYQIWSRGGRLLLSSQYAPVDRPMMPLDQSGLSTREIDGVSYRVITVVAPAGEYRLQAAEPVSERLQPADLFGHYLWLAIVFSALALGVLSVVLLRLALKPLHAAAGQIAERGPADLRAIAPEEAPAEFAPVLGAVNQLMRRVDVALRSEREFVSAAAHELRTPLAGLHAQAQLAAHPRTSAEDRNAALHALQEGVDHAAHLVNQLLDLARSDALAGDPARLLTDRQSVDLRRLLQRVLGELGPQAAERGLQIQQRLAVPTLSGSEFGVTLILRNLLANAVAHAPPEGRVAVGSRQEGRQVVLWVADSGPGIAPAERERMFERFARAKGNEAPGCGLGLSIVKALADAHGAQVRLDTSELGGLLAEVSFPPAD